MLFITNLSTNCSDAQYQLSALAVICLQTELSIDRLQGTPVLVLISQRAPFLPNAARLPQCWDVHRLIIYTAGQADFID